MIDALLFAGFVVSALWAALRCRRSELAARRDIEDLFSSPNKRLVRLLRYKADIYGPFGRIYSFEHKWGVSPTGELLLDGVPVDPHTLRDGNGRIITCER